MLQYLIDSFVAVWPVVRVVLMLAPIWLPVLMVYGFWTAWVRWRHTKFILSQEPVLLEVRIPKEINKSPLAMEIVLSALFNTGGEGDFKEKYWKGGVRSWSSLELVSIEGRVHFFIWTWKGGVKSIQNNIYAQYPTTEIVEVPDYTLAFLYDKDRADLYGVEFGLSKPDPYPIKTYIDYGMDRDPKEEFKIDPITPVIEYLGGLGAGEQAWIQIIVRAHKAEDKKKGGLFAGITKIEDVFDIGKKVGDQMKPTDKWKDDVKAEIESVIKKRKIQSADGTGPMKLTSFEEDVVAALERSVSKLGFDVGIRALYLGEKDKFNPANKAALNGVFAQYNSQYLNGFKKAGGMSEEKFFEAYRARGFFHPPYKRKWFVLNTEELATIYHFPGGVSQTPTFGRIESRKSEPPSNLPV